MLDLGSSAEDEIAEAVEDGDLEQLEEMVEENPDLAGDIAAEATPEQL